MLKFMQTRETLLLGPRASRCSLDCIDCTDVELGSPLLTRQYPGVKDFIEQRAPRYRSLDVQAYMQIPTLVVVEGEWDVVGTVEVSVQRCHVVLHVVLYHDPVVRAAVLAVVLFIAVVTYVDHTGQFSDQTTADEVEAALSAWAIT
jgi:hypothetical protein